jgi:hypothetical protein
VRLSRNPSFVTEIMCTRTRKFGHIPFMKDMPFMMGQMIEFTHQSRAYFFVVLTLFTMLVISPFQARVSHISNNVCYHLNPCNPTYTRPVFRIYYVHAQARARRLHPLTVTTSILHKAPTNIQPLLQANILNHTANTTNTINRDYKPRVLTKALHLALTSISL